MLITSEMSVLIFFYPKHYLHHILEIVAFVGHDSEKFLKNFPLYLWILCQKIDGKTQGVASSVSSSYNEHKGSKTALCWTHALTGMICLHCIKHDLREIPSIVSLVMDSSSQRVISKLQTIELVLQNVYCARTSHSGPNTLRILINAAYPVGNISFSSHAWSLRDGYVLHYL